MKTALVLEGGGMRGVFTAGVLDFFHNKALHFDMLFGVSAGACHACSFLSGQYKRAFDVSCDYLNNKNYCGAYSLIKTGDLFGVKMIYDDIPNRLNPYDYNAFLENKTAFYAVVTNCITGKPEYKRIADMRTDLIHVRASSSLPGVSRLVYIDGVPYLDGGISDSIPVRESLRRGANKTVIVLTQHDGYRKNPSGMLAYIKLKYRKYPKLIACIKNRHVVYNKTLDYIEEQADVGSVFVIRPQEPLRVGRIEKDRGKLKATYDKGYSAAAHCYGQLKHYLSATNINTDQP
jgi:predicted patatin/cPLA2 family phospholipase